MGSQDLSEWEIRVLWNGKTESLSVGRQESPSIKQTVQKRHAILFKLCMKIFQGHTTVFFYFYI